MRHDSIGTAHDVFVSEIAVNQGNSITGVFIDGLPVPLSETVVLDRQFGHYRRAIYGRSEITVMLNDTAIGKTSLERDSFLDLSRNQIDTKKIDYYQAWLLQGNFF